MYCLRIGDTPADFSCRTSILALGHKRFYHRLSWNPRPHDVHYSNAHVELQRRRVRDDGRKDIIIKRKCCHGKSDLENWAPRMCVDYARFQQFSIATRSALVSGTTDLCKLCSDVKVRLIVKPHIPDTGCSRLKMWSSSLRINWRWRSYGEVKPQVNPCAEVLRSNGSSRRSLFCQGSVLQCQPIYCRSSCGPQSIVFLHPLSMHLVLCLVSTDCATFLYTAFQSCQESA